MNRVFDAQVGAQLKARRSRGWSHRDVDSHMGWPPGTLRYVEHGKLPLTLEHATRIGALYDFDISDLVKSVQAVLGTDLVAD